MTNPSLKIMPAFLAGGLALAGCDNPTASTDPSGDGSRTVPPIEWIWTSGHTIANLSGFYGTKGEADPDNMPGARSSALSWSDESGNLWLFGGRGYDSAGENGRFNDLWRFDGEAWTWVSGSASIDESGTYGTRTVPDADNVPGARSGAVSWIDARGNLWLFGGFGYDSAGDDIGYLNDLWRFDGEAWTWISGSNTGNELGMYGTKGEAAADNVPGARSTAVSWRDESGNLWLFGGWGRDSTTDTGFLNDLWRFDGAAWTWVSGSDSLDESGTYGTKGEAAADNVPGARSTAVSWRDGSGNLWLFGGYGRDGGGAFGDLNDLWRFDGAAWTWVSGSDTTDEYGTYGTKGVAAADNAPGARSHAVSWSDKSGELWLFGGFGYDSGGEKGLLNDLWRFAP